MNKAIDKVTGARAVHETLFQALAAAQIEMGPALKDAKNEAFKRDGKALAYATLQSALEACLPALNAHGIAVLQPPVEQDGNRYVKTILAHESGETVECLVPLIIGKNDMQGYGSAVTYARRYGLMAMAGIAPDDDDGNAAVKAAPSKEQPSNTDVIDQITAFTAAVSTAIISLQTAEDGEAFARAWNGLSEDVRADAAVLKAKRERKAELLEATKAKRVTADLDDEIPY